MATYARNSRLIKMYHKPLGRYSSFGPVDAKPKRIKIEAYYAKSDNGKLLSFMLIANK